MAITEERMEMMMMAVSPANTHPVLKKAHFLAPTVTSDDDAAIAPPPAAAAAPGSAKSFTPTFLGWRTPKDNWRTWVDQMHALHHSTWRRAGILDAVVASKCHVMKDQDLLFRFLENYWCPATNTFVFPWGEATITLEDVMVLGGYSVLGRPVFGPYPDGATREAVEKLNNGRSMISKSKAKKAFHNGWITVYQGSGSEIEHETFLAYWLSRFVFPFWRDAIGRSVLPVAASLARGTKIALAPAVLAGIYSNLTSLKAALVNPSDEHFEVRVTAPLSLVQVWIWERFRFLSPNAMSIGQHEPRLARWNEVEKEYTPAYHMIESSRQQFEWRPYTRSPSNGVPSITGENGFWAIADSDFGSDDLEGLMRCLRTSDLVGLDTDTIEQYQPHRVAMQFGLDQDLPGHVARVSMSPQIAWRHYSQPSEGATVYVPPRLYEGCVSDRYFRWWRKMRTGGEGSGSGSGSGSGVEITRGLFGRMFELLPRPPGFSPKFKTVSLHKEGTSSRVPSSGFIGSSSLRISDHNHGGGARPPGFSPFHNPVRDSVSDRKRVNSYEEGTSSSRAPKRTSVGSSSRRTSGDPGDISPPPGFTPTHSPERASGSGQRSGKSSG